MGVGVAAFSRERVARNCPSRMAAANTRTEYCRNTLVASRNAFRHRDREDIKTAKKRGESGE